MHKVCLAVACAAMPFTALAHDGHGGIGLFHHAIEMMPALVVAAVVWGGWRWINKR